MNRRIRIEVVKVSRRLVLPERSHLVRDLGRNLDHGVWSKLVEIPTRVGSWNVELHVWGQLLRGDVREQPAREAQYCIWRHIPDIRKLLLGFDGKVKIHVVWQLIKIDAAQIAGLDDDWSVWIHVLQVLNPAEETGNSVRASGLLQSSFPDGLIEMANWDLEWHVGIQSIQSDINGILLWLWLWLWLVLRLWLLVLRWRRLHAIRLQRLTTLLWWMHAAVGEPIGVAHFAVLVAVAPLLVVKHKSVSWKPVSMDNIIEMVSFLS